MADLAGMDGAGPRPTLVDDRVRIGGHEYAFRRPPSAEALIDEREYERDERLPYWAELWPSGVVLAEALAAMDLAGRRVVELGCGLALPSLVALRAGADVLATDWYPEALRVAAENARTAVGAELATMLVDWRDPPAGLLTRRADLVIGADVLYEARNGVALAALLPRLVARDGAVVIADPRRPDARHLLDPLADAGWSEECEEVHHGARTDESGAIVRVHRLRPPGASAVPGTSDTLERDDPR